MYNDVIITYSEEYSLACINYPSDSILTWYPCVALTTPIGNSTERKPKVTKKKYFLFGENNKWNKVTNQVCWYDWRNVQPKKKKLLNKLIWDSYDDIQEIRS